MAVLDSERGSHGEPHEIKSQEQRPTDWNVEHSSSDGSSRGGGDGKGPDTAVAVVTADASVGGLGAGMRHRSRPSPLGEQAQAELPGVGAPASSGPAAVRGSGLAPCGDCDACTAVAAATKAVAAGHIKPD